GRAAPCGAGFRPALSILFRLAAQGGKGGKGAVGIEDRLAVFPLRATILVLALVRAAPMLVAALAIGLAAIRTGFPFRPARAAIIVARTLVATPLLGLAVAIAATARLVPALIVIAAAGE